MPDPECASAAHRARGEGASRLNFALHFVLLVCAAVVYIGVLAHVDLTFPRPVAEHLLFTRAGALHGVALALALRAPPALARRALFVVLAAALAATATHAGLWLSEALGSLGRRAGHELSFHEDVTLAIVLTAALGAVAYGFLVRALWLPRLSRSAPVRIALACIAAMLVMAAALPPEHYLDWFVVLWWFVFSTALWWFCRGRPPDDGPLIEPRG